MQYWQVNCSNNCESSLAPSSESSFDTLDVEKGQVRANAYDFNQGQILSTGGIMDLALEGKGFFILKNQSQYLYFRRPGHFIQDANGFLTLGNDKAQAASPFPRLFFKTQRKAPY